MTEHDIHNSIFAEALDLYIGVWWRQLLIYVSAFVFGISTALTADGYFHLPVGQVVPLVIVATTSVLLLLPVISVAFFRFIGGPSASTVSNDDIDQRIRHAMQRQEEILRRRRIQIVGAAVKTGSKTLINAQLQAERLKMLEKVISSGNLSPESATILRSVTEALLESQRKSFNVWKDPDHLDSEANQHFKDGYWDGLDTVLEEVFQNVMKTLASMSLETKVHEGFLYDRERGLRSKE